MNSVSKELPGTMSFTDGVAMRFMRTGRANTTPSKEWEESGVRSPKQVLNLHFSASVEYSQEG